MPEERHSVRATVADGLSTTGLIDLRGFRLAGLQVPASYAATGATFKATFLPEDSPYDEVPNSPLTGLPAGALLDEEGGTVTVVLAAGSYTAFGPALLCLFSNLRYVEVVFDAAASGDQEVILATRPWE